MDIIVQTTKIFTLGMFSFLLTIAFAPLVEFLLRKFKAGKQIRHDERAPIFYQLHKAKEGTPTMAGVLFWGITLLLTVLFFVLGKIFGGAFEFLNFLNRRETLLPLGALVASALVGAFDDIMGILRIGSSGGGLKVRHKLLIYTGIAIFGAWWFYVKLGINTVHVPFIGEWHLGVWYPLLFIFILVASIFSSNETDGLDGLLGGIALSSSAPFLVIAFVAGNFNLAAFLAVLMGGLIGFLWFNIWPARFFMGDTGSMSLGVTLGVLAMLTNTPFLLPFFAFILVLESLSVLVQIASKKLRKKKVFLSTPLHHHFQARGWQEPTVVMRLWIINGLFASFGLILFFIERFL